MAGFFICAVDGVRKPIEEAYIGPLETDEMSEDWPRKRLFTVSFDGGVTTVKMMKCKTCVEDGL